MLPIVKRCCYVGLIMFVCATAVLVAVGMSDRIAYADMIVVPGNTVGPNGKPSARLQARLDAALNLYRGGYAPIIFVSGGTGKEGFDEAQSMFNYLAEQGVPPGAVVRDDEGVDTEATAKNAAEFMRGKNLRTALVATQYFHVPRTKLALERHHVQVNGNLHPAFFELRDLYSSPREVVAYFVYVLRGAA